MATIAIGISPTKGGASIAKVPVNSLAEDGVPPEEGDKVQCSVEGTVQSVSGGTATVSIDSVNGEPIGEQGDEGSAEEENEDQGTPPTPPPPGAGGGPSGAKSGADGLGRPFGLPVAKPRRAPGSAIMPSGETLGQMGKRLRGAARGKALPF